MEEKLKDLLLKDLSARLPYGVKVKENYHTEVCVLRGIDLVHKTIVMEGRATIFNGISIFSGNGKAKVKPYLRPMSSMTEEEKKEMHEKLSPTGTAIYKEEGISTPLNHYSNWIPYEYMSRIIDWLNAHHFDYRGLIPMGLAKIP